MTSTNKKTGNLQGTRRADAIEGSRVDETLQGGAGEDTLNGGKGDDVIVGGEGADDFELSAGNDVVQDFNWREGDQIVLPQGTDLSQLLIEKEGRDIVIKISNDYKTIIEDTNPRDVIKTISDKALENALDSTPPEGTSSEQTIVNTGLITKGINNEIHLPTQSGLENVMVFDAEGNQLKEGERGFVVNGRKVTINKTVPGYYKIAAEFDWNNPNGSTRENYLTWMRDVIQFGDKDGKDGADPIEASSAFRLYMGDKISAIGDLKIGDSTSTYQMFDAAARFDGDLSNLNLKGVTDMYAMFRHAARFNNGGSDGINSWDTSSVGTTEESNGMRMAFWNALSFHQPLDNWKVENVKDKLPNGGMSRMFKNTPKFDQNLSSWVTNLSPELQTSFNTNLIGDKTAQEVRYPNTALPEFKGKNTYDYNEYVLRTRNLRGPRWKYLWNDKEDYNKGVTLKLPIVALKNEDLIVSAVDNNNKTQNIEQDGNTINITSDSRSANQYTIKIKGGIWDNSYDDNNFNSANKLKWLDDVLHFGDTNGEQPGGIFETGIAAFAGYGGDSISDLNNLDVSDVSNIKSARKMFSEARRFNQNVDIFFDNKKENITDTYGMFDGARSFNNGGSDSIGNWDTSSITYMRSMFRRATAFDQVSIKDWNVSSVTDQGNVGGMQEMFLYTPLFNADLSGWNATNLSLNLNTNFNTDSRGVPQGNWPKFEAKELNFNTAPKPYENLKLSTTGHSGNSDLRAAAFGNNKFVAGGGNGTILTSTDGSSWTPEGEGEIEGVVQGLEYGRNVFLAVTGNKDGTGTGSLYFTSEDGMVWGQKEVEGGNGLNYLDATFGNNIFIIPSKEGKVVIDGYGKTEAIAVSKNELRAATYGNNEFIVAGKNGAVYSSSDGIGWNDESSRKFNFKTLVEDLQSIGRLPESDALDQVLGDENNKLSEIYINFNAATSGDDTHIIAGTGGAIFFKNSESNDWKFANSPFKINESITSLNYADGLFIAGGTNGKTALSVDGSFWFEEPIEGYPSIDKDTKGNYNLNALASGNGIVIGVSSNETIAKIKIGSQSGNRQIFKQKKNELNGIDTNLTYLLGTTSTTTESNEGKDKIIAEDGSDYFLKGYGKADTLHGADGNDTIVGDQGVDSLLGKAGNDEIFGGIGNDSISGGDGKDTLDGGDGDDTLKGGNNADLFSLAINGDTDTISDFSNSKDNKLMAPPISSGIKIETEKPSDGDNKEKRNIIIRLSDDTTTSTTILENISKSEFEGGLRQYIFEKLGISILESNKGIDNKGETLKFESPNDLYKEGVLISPFTLANALGNDVDEETIADKSLEINAGIGADAVRGGNKSDSISGNEGADTVYGGDGKDTIDGGDGDDTIDGGAGQDLLEGGPGNDQYVLSTSEGEDGKVGMDTIKGYETGDKIVLPGVTRQIDVDGLVEVSEKQPSDSEGNIVDKNEEALAAYELTYEITRNSSKAKSNQSANGKTLVVTTGSFLPTADVAITSVTSDVTNPTISGTNGQLRTGEKVEISSDSGKTWATVNQETSTTWSFIDKVDREDNQTVIYKIQVVDEQENVGTKTAERVVTIEIPGSGGGDNGGGGDGSGGDGGTGGGDGGTGGGDGGTGGGDGGTGGGDGGTGGGDGGTGGGDGGTGGGDGGNSGGGEGEPPVVLPDIPVVPEKPTPEPSPDEEIEGGIDNAPGNGGGSSGGDGGNSGGGNSGGGNSGGDGTIDDKPINPPMDPEVPDQPDPIANELRSIDIDPKPRKSAFKAISRGSSQRDTVIGGNSIDKLRGQEKSDLLRGKNGDDYLYGEDNADTLKGGKGSDVLQGGNGKDKLLGGSGADILYGGVKADELTGNAGKDIFILSSGKDVVTDFKVGTDAIGLVYALNLQFKQKENDLLIKGDEGVKTLLLNVEKEQFLANFPDNLELMPVVEINLI